MEINPLLVEFDTPFQTPPFNLIQLEHFKPAFEEAIQLHKKEINQILEETKEASFENTVEALEFSGQVLTQVSRVFFNLNSAHTSDAMQAIAQEIAPKLSEHGDDINLNPVLFARVKAVWEQKDEPHLESDQVKLLDDLYISFVRGGAHLDEKGKARLREINQQLAVSTLKFGQNVLAETNAFQLVVDAESDLKGLPNSVIEAAKVQAQQANKDSKWIFTLQNPSVMPFLQYAESRTLREKIWNAYRLRCDQDNEFSNNQIIQEITNLRIERAQLLGYKTHADFVLEHSMAKNPSTVLQLLNDLWKPALMKSKKEADDMKELIKKEGNSFDLAPWDWSFYAEKIRKERFDLDETELSEYFSLDAVRDGIFYVVQQLYGLRFRIREDISVYHEEVIAYEVLDATDDHLGVLYMDFHPRASKRGGAWMTSYRAQTKKMGSRQAPIISIVSNFSRPTEGKPALLTFDEVETFFHEFGHALHGLLSDVQYQSQAGTAVTRDFVELPSQIMENWAAEPQVLKKYAKQYQTGETIPDSLIEKLQAAGTFNQGFATLEYLAASFLDMYFHIQVNPISEDISNQEKKEMKKLGLPQEIIPRYRSTYFQHVFSGGYSAGYYSYIWSGVLDTDAFDAFKQSGDIFNPALAKAFRTQILERGDTGNPMEMYVAFRGREPKIDALLKKRGLDSTNCRVG